MQVVAVVEVVAALLLLVVVVVVGGGEGAEVAATTTLDEIIEITVRSKQGQPEPMANRTSKSCTSGNHQVWC
jgi:hypothetical protein